MKIKQTIKKIEEEIERRNKKHREKARKFRIEPLSDNGWEDTIELESKLSGYKLALKDVLSEIDVFFKSKKKILTKKDTILPKKIIEYTEEILTKLKEELKFPIQEILKDRVEVLK